MTWSDVTSRDNNAESSVFFENVLIIRKALVLAEKLQKLVFYSDIYDFKISHKSFIEKYKDKVVPFLGLFKNGLKAYERST